MRYDEFMKVVVNSDVDDWIYDDAKGLFVFKDDLLISILGSEIEYSDSGKFSEDWATGFPDADARKKQFELCYAGQLIESVYTASVDGGRMYIPYPDIDDLSISNNQYKLGKILNIMNEVREFDSYLKRAGITVK